MKRLTPKLCLDAKQQKDLQKILRSVKVEVRMQFRASIIWGLAMEKQNENQVARELGTTVKTVRKWQNRYINYGLKGLDDLPRSGAPAKFDVCQRCEVIAIACDQPKNYGFSESPTWNLDRLTQVVQKEVEGPVMSRSSVFRTLNENELKPHKLRMWLHSKDPEFKEKVNDIVSLYIDPPKDAVVLSIDEKTGMQALERKYETRLPQQGKPGRYEYEYIRHGTQSLIASFETQTGEVYGECGSTRKAEDLERFMENIARKYEDYSKIIVIWDNLNIHHDGPTSRWSTFNERHNNKFEFHYTPLHASWVNQVEIFFSIVQKRCLKWASSDSTEELKEKIMAFIQRWNALDGHPFNWTFRGYPMQSKEKEAA